MILCIGPTPALQRVMMFKKLSVDSVNRAIETIDSIAGKSINVAKVLKTLGYSPMAVAFIGGSRGEQLKKQVEARSIRAEFVHVEAETRQCITVIDRESGTQTELVEESRAVHRKSYEMLLATVTRRVRGCEAVVMSGTLTPGAPEDFYFKCARAARAAKALIVLDAKGTPLMRSLGVEPDVIKPNRSELEATLGKPLRTERQLQFAMRDLGERGAKNVVVTFGAKPALAFDGRDFWQIKSPEIDVVNPIGSGDAFTAGLVSRLVKGDTFAEACRWGAACGAANARTMMAAEVVLKDVLRLLRHVKVQKLPV